MKSVTTFCTNAFTLILSLAAIAGVMWAGFQIHQDYENKFQTMDTRITSIENISDPETGAKILMRLDSVEERVSEAERVVAQVKTETSQASSTVAGISDALDKRVLTIEKNNAEANKAGLVAFEERIAALEGGGAAASDGGALTEIVTRMDALEKGLKKARTSGSNNGNFGDIEIKSDYTDEYTTMVVNGYLEVSLRGCQRKGKENVRCAFIVKNNDDETVGAYIYPKKSRVYSPDGVEHYGVRIMIGEKSSTDRIGRDYPSDVPVQVLIDFQGVSEDASGLMLVQVKTSPSSNGEYSEYADFKKVAIQ